MRLITTVALAAALLACAQPDGGTRSPAPEIPARVQIGGAGVFMVVESTGGAGDAVAHEVPVRAEGVWRALPRTFDEAGLRGAGVIDASRRTFGYPNAVIPRSVAGTRLSSFLSCGQTPGGDNADVHRVTGSIVAVVRPAAEPDRAVVEVTVDAAARPREVSGGAVRCSSNGRLERLLAYTATKHAIEDMLPDM